MPAKDAMPVAAACACHGLALIEIANENLFLLRSPHFLRHLPSATPALSLANVSLTQLSWTIDRGLRGRCGTSPNSPVSGQSALY